MRNLNNTRFLHLQDEEIGMTFQLSIPLSIELVILFILIGAALVEAHKRKDYRTGLTLVCAIIAIFVLGASFGRYL